MSQIVLGPLGRLVLSLLIFCSMISPSLPSPRPVLPDSLPALKLKILKLQKFSAPAGARDKRNSDHLEETAGKQSALDVYGSKLAEDEMETDKEFTGRVKRMRSERQGKVMKVRKRARFPRRSYGGYESPSKSKSYRPPVSYKAPSPKVSTHRPYVANKPKSKPFTSFRSISSSKGSKPGSTYSVTTPSYSAPEPPSPTYSVKSSSPSPTPSIYSKPPSQSYSKPPSPSYSKPPTPSYSRPPSPSYSKPSSPSYSKPSSPSYSKPSSPSYSKPSSPSYSKPSSPSYSKPSSPSYSKPPSPSYSKPPSSSYSKVAPSSYSSSEDSPSKYSYSYTVPETETQAWEERNGYSTTGSYSVLLPDGRTMTVSYSVPDTETGFVAEVSYQGEAQYEEYKPRQQYNYKREAKLQSRSNKNRAPHFQTSKQSYTENNIDLDKELQLPKLDTPKTSLKFKKKETKDKSFKRNKEVRYPHFESFQYSGNLKNKAKLSQLEPFQSLYGEFPQLNTRQGERRQKQSLHFIPPESEAVQSHQYPEEILQELYQTNFSTEGRDREHYGTSVQPFVYIQPQKTKVKTVREDKYG